MAKETKNLKLHQVTRPEDDSKAFNLETMLNENWEKLDSAVGDLSQPVTTAEGAAIGLRVQNGRLQYKNNESWTELELEYEDIQNLAATPAGVITWTLPQSTDNTRTAIVLCRATKDISNMDYSACLADASITKNTLAQNATSNTYTGLTNATQYWVKAFVKYTLGGKEFYSGGVTVTFTTLAIVDVTNLSVNPTTETVTWALPNGSNHIGINIAYSKTNITNFTLAQCQSDPTVVEIGVGTTTTSYRPKVLDKATYYVKVFLYYTGQASNGVSINWYNPLQYLYNRGVENPTIGTFDVGYQKGKGYQSKGTEYLNLVATEDVQGSARSYSTNYGVNLTGKTTIFIEWENVGTADSINFSFLAIAPNKMNSAEAETTQRRNSGAYIKSISQLDVSNAYNKNLYLLVQAFYAGTTQGTSNLKIHRIWIE